MSELLHHNQPPDMTATAGETAKDLSDWMALNPVIETEDQARDAKVYIDRGSLCVKDLEDERTNQVRPLNERVKQINDYYRTPRELLERVCDELKFRVTDFIAKEEAKRIAAAEEAKRSAERAKENARIAERMEKEAIESAEAGACDISVVDAISGADRAFADYQKAERQAVIAEMDAKVKIAGGFTRALSLKSRETLEVTDLLAAVTAMKDSGRIIEAVIKAARSYEKVYGKYPPGIAVHIERKV